MSGSVEPDAEFDAPEKAPFRCPHCSRAFAREQFRDLHLGLEHRAYLNDDEREAYEAALAEEERGLRLFRYKALLALIVIYFGFIMIYAFSL